MCGHIWFQYATMSDPALIVAVSCSAPAAPGLLHARVGSVASWIGLLCPRQLRRLVVTVLIMDVLARPRPLDPRLACRRVVWVPALVPVARVGVGEDAAVCEGGGEEGEGEEGGEGEHCC